MGGGSGLLSMMVPKAQKNILSELSGGINPCFDPFTVYIDNLLIFFIPVTDNDLS